MSGRFFALVWALQKIPAINTIAPVPGTATGTYQAVFAIPAASLRDGRNTLAVRNEGESLTIISLDVRITGD